MLAVLVLMAESPVTVSAVSCFVGKQITQRRPGLTWPVREPVCEIITHGDVVSGCRVVYKNMNIKEKG